MRSSTTLLLAAATLASAHFDITFPTQRGDTHSTQGTGPCGGINRASSERTPWPLTGGRLEFKAGHDEAITEVRVAIGNDFDDQDDFDLVLAPVFNQVGFGNFCWNNLAVPAGAEGVKDGVNATIQVRQGGHGDGWLYNCADIVFSASAEVGSACKNDTGISAEPVVGPTPPDGDDDDSDDNDDNDDNNDDDNNDDDVNDDTDDQDDNNDTGAASSLTIASGAAVLGMAAGLLALF